MYTRKLVKSGLSSHTVALPQEFIKDNNLERGNTVYLERKGPSTLIISAQPEKKEKEKSVKVIEVGNRPLNHIQSDIIKAYVNNHKEIIVKLNSSVKAQEIKKYINSLVALEVVQEDNEKIVAKDFLNYEDKEIERTLRRIEHMVCSMIMDLKNIENNEAAQVIVERDKEVNRLGFLVMRILQVASTDPALAANLRLDTLNTMRLWSVNMHLEKIGDDAKRIARLIVHINKPQTKKLHSILDQVLLNYKDTFTAIHNNEITKMDENLDRRFEIMKELDAFVGANPTATISETMSLLKQMLSHLTDINRVYRYCSN